MRHLPSARCPAYQRAAPLILLGALSLLPLSASAAYCRATSNPPPNKDQLYFQPDKVIVSDDDPVGTVLWTHTFHQPAYVYADCGINGRSNDNMYLAGVSAYALGYWQSNVPGLGFRIQRDGHDMTRADQRVIGPGRVSSTASIWIVSLVKTAPDVGRGDLWFPVINGNFSTGETRIGNYFAVTPRGRTNVP